MMRQLAVAITLLAFITVIAPCYAANASRIDQILQGLTRRYSQLKTLSAEFIQEVEHRAIGRKSVATGKVLFKRPNMFRWIMLNPPGDEMISDGKTLWIYQPELAQVVKSPAKGSTPALVTGLIGRLHALEEDFQITYQGEVSGLLALKLVPKRDRYPFVEWLTLYIDPKDYSLQRIDIEQSMDRATTIRFNSVVLNPILSDSLFHYSPPKGVTIVEP